MENNYKSNKYLLLIAYLYIQISNFENLKFYKYEFKEICFGSIGVYQQIDWIQIEKVKLRLIQLQIM